VSIGSASDVRALYVHVPFCERKCEYCDFMSVAGKRAEREYSGALQGEIRMLGERCPGITLDTVFFGGGTPSFIDPELLAGILREVRSAFRVDRNAEVTLEANPSSTDRGRAAAWLEAGFNRVSIGVQSLEADALRFLGRVHDARRALSAIGEVRDAGFSAVNCDLIYAVPRLGDARWRRTLQRVIAAAPDHVSCYELTVEAGTPLHVSVARGAVTPVAGWRALRQHRIAVDELAAAGYAQYEVSNFARRDARCRHNLVYWTGGHYLAAGVAAHGHLPASVALTAGVVDHTADAASVRYWHGRGIAAYIAAIDAGDLPVHGVELITAATRERERLILGLRLRDGVSIDDARARSAAELLMDRGLLEAAGTRVRTTARGEAVLNQVALMLTEDLAA
jgi:oxygen-independent coproporphyrinogen-3 oxidase